VRVEITQALGWVGRPKTCEKVVGSDTVLKEGLPVVLGEQAEGKSEALLILGIPTAGPRSHPRTDESAAKANECCEKLGIHAILQAWRVLSGVLAEAMMGAP
jgi:hypothetical protein